MKFIKLTSAMDGKKIYINFEKMEIFGIYDGETRIFTGKDDDMFVVKETPEKIEKLLADEKILKAEEDYESSLWPGMVFEGPPVNFQKFIEHYQEYLQRCTK